MLSSTNSKITEEDGEEGGASRLSNAYTGPNPSSAYTLSKLLRGWSLKKEGFYSPRLKRGAEEEDTTSDESSNDSEDGWRGAGAPPARDRNRGAGDGTLVGALDSDTEDILSEEESGGIGVAKFWCDLYTEGREEIIDTIKSKLADLRKRTPPVKDDDKSIAWVNTLREELVRLLEDEEGCEDEEPS